LGRKTNIACKPKREESLGVIGEEE
jgi:hypothetical protein